jgi:hypothetical protein
MEPTLLESITSAGKSARNLGLRTGVLVSIDEQGTPGVCCHPGSDRAVAARSLVRLGAADLGRTVALMPLDDGDDRLVVVGVFQDRASAHDRADVSAQLRVDGRQVKVVAQDVLELRCGSSSIKLTKDGRIAINGTYLLSVSTGTNRILGAAVQIN